MASGHEKRSRDGNLMTKKTKNLRIKRSHKELQYSCLENPMNREAWRTTVHGVKESQTRLSDTEKAMDLPQLSR